MTDFNNILILHFTVIIISSINIIVTGDPVFHVHVRNLLPSSLQWQFLSTATSSSTNSPSRRDKELYFTESVRKVDLIDLKDFININTHLEWWSNFLSGLRVD